MTSYSQWPAVKTMLDGLLGLLTTGGPLKTNMSSLASSSKTESLEQRKGKLT